MNDKITELISLLRVKRFSTFNEKITQSEIEKVLTGYFSFEREKRLDAENIIDFFVNDEIGVEVKIAGKKKAIYRQCERYCLFDEIKYLILVTAKPIALPTHIHNKPCFVLNTSYSWL